MSNYITLLGAEDVQRAGRSISSAASEMNKVAANMQYVFEQHQRFLDDWLDRFNEALAKLHKGGE